MVTVELFEAVTKITGRDSDLEAIIPLALSYAVNYCNNYFHSGDSILGYYSYSAADNKIIKSGEAFDYNYSAGQTIHVEGSRFNDDYYTVVSANDYEIVVLEPLIEEINDLAEDSITPVSFPKGFDLALINFIKDQFILKQSVRSDLQSESIGDYSYSVGAGGSSGESILSYYFKPFRKVGVF